MISPTAQIAAAPSLVPFIGPEHLARQAALDVGALLRLGANESGFGAAPAVIAALTEALPQIAHYGDPENYDLRLALAQLYDVEPQAILVANGIDELMGLLIRAYLAPGETVVMTHGSYPTFSFHVLSFGGQLITAEYDNAKPNLTALARIAQRERPRIVYLANPDNPSGGFWAQSEVEAFLDEVPPESLIFLDEAYAEYAPEPCGTRYRENVFCLRTFSKAYGLAGMRIGYAFVPPETTALCEKIRLHFGVTRLAQVAALAALQRPCFVNSVIAETARGRAEYAQFACELGLRVYPSATNFMLFELDTVARAEHLVQELFCRKVFIRKPGAGPLASSVRITVGNAMQRRVLRQAFGEALHAVDASSTR